MVNNKIYVGQSQDIYTRFRKHKEALRKNKHVNKHLQNAWNKSGEISFDFIISQECITQQLTYQEQMTFNYFKNFIGVYNKGDFTNSPMRGSKWNQTQKTKDKISLSKMGDKNPMKRVEVRKKSSFSHIGLKYSEETKQKMSLSSNKIRPERFVKIERIELFTGEIKEYQSIKSTKEDGFDPGCISNCLAGKHNIHKGFCWQYVGDVI